MYSTGLSSSEHKLGKRNSVKLNHIWQHIDNIMIGYCVTKQHEVMKHETQHGPMKFLLLVPPYVTCLDLEFSKFNLVYNRGAQITDLQNSDFNEQFANTNICP